MPRVHSFLGKDVPRFVSSFTIFYRDLPLIFRCKIFVFCKFLQLNKKKEKKKSEEKQFFFFSKICSSAEHCRAFSACLCEVSEELT